MLQYMYVQHTVNLHKVATVYYSPPLRHDYTVLVQSYVYMYIHAQGYHLVTVTKKCLKVVILCSEKSM